MLGFDAIGRLALGEVPTSDATVAGWGQPLSTPPVLKKKISIALIASGMAPISPWALTQPETVTESRWHLPWSEPVRFRRIPTALQSASGWFGLLGAGTQEIVYEDKWHFPWSEPIVKNKIGLRAASQEALSWAPRPPIVSFSYFNWLSEPVRIKRGIRPEEQPFLFFNTEPVVPFSWFGWLSDPARIKIGMKVQDQPFFYYQPRPIIDISWFNPFSEPARLKPRIRAGLNPFQFFADRPPLVSFSYYNWLTEPVRLKRGMPPQPQSFFEYHPNPSVSFGWFENLSDPVRIPKRLLEALQAFISVNFPSPFSYTAVIDAYERGDIFLGVLYGYDEPVDAYVDIIEIGQDDSYVSLIENNHDTGNISIIDPIPVPSSGTPVVTAASAVVSIIQVG